MASRAAVFSKNLLRNFNLTKAINTQGVKNVQPRMPVGTYQKPPLENATKKSKTSFFKKYYELIPLFVIVGGGIIGLMCYVVRIAMTRDDVRYLKHGKMDFETFELEKNKPPKVKKFLTINQKYEFPPGLVEAMAAIKENENSQETEK